MKTKKTTPEAKIYGNNDESWVNHGRARELSEIIMKNYKITMYFSKLALGILVFNMILYLAFAFLVWDIYWAASDGTVSQILRLIYLMICIITIFANSIPPNDSK